MNSIIILSYVSGALGILSAIPYIVSTLKGVTQPERNAWLIWLLLDFVLVFSQLAKGGSWSVLMTVGFLLSDLVILLLSLKYGYRNKISKRDYLALLGVGLGAALWVVSKEAAVAIFAAIVIDAMGGVLTVIKSYENPRKENLTKWIFTNISAVLACFAVGSINIFLLAFPIFIFLQSGAVIIAIVLGRFRPVSIITPEFKVFDFQKSLDFYKNLVDFTVVYDRPEHDFAMFEINGGRLMIEGLTEKSRAWLVGNLEQPLGRGINFQIEVKDIQSLYKKLLDAKYPIFLEMEDKWYRMNDEETGNRQFLVQDPDGYLLRFFEDLGVRSLR